MTPKQAHKILNQLFDGHLSRNADNIRAAIEKHGIPENYLTDLEQIGLVVRLPYSQVHFERQAFGERAITELLNQKTQHQNE